MTGANTSTDTTSGIGYDDAMRILWAAVTGDDDLPARMIRAVLLLHRGMPAGQDGPNPGCTFCAGTGVGTGPDNEGEHCHCGCPLCSCGDPMCDDRLCEHVEAMLEEVLGGVPPAAIDVPRTLAYLHGKAIRRLAVRAIARVRQENTAQAAQRIIRADLDDADPAAPLLLILTGLLDADAATEALRRNGYRCAHVGDAAEARRLGVVRIQVAPPAPSAPTTA